MQKVVSEYKVIHSSCANELSEKVCTLINDGWQPYGSIAYAEFCPPASAYNEATNQFVQAMVRYDEIGFL